MVKKIVQNVETMCKTTRKSMRKIVVKICAKNNSFIQHIKFSAFPHCFPAIPTTFPTIFYYLFISRLFHFSTSPTITTINI